MLEFSVLGSGSSGNCALVRNGRTTFLLDAGLSARQIERRMEARGVGADELKGILLTHEHGDHTRGIDVFCRKRGIPVYCTAMTREVVREGMRAEIEWRLFESGQSFDIEELGVESFPVPHDAVDPLGFVIRNAESSMGVLSDVGHVTNLVRTRLRATNTLFVEANYDEVLLQNDTRRPWPTKQRISSRHGHLSNEQAAELITEVATERLALVILGHLSGDCNDPGLASGVVARKLGQNGFPQVRVCCASQGEPTEWFRVGGQRAGGMEEEEGALAAEQESLL